MEVGGSGCLKPLATKGSTQRRMSQRRRGSEAVTIATHSRRAGRSRLIAPGQSLNVSGRRSPLFGDVTHRPWEAVVNVEKPKHVTHGFEQPIEPLPRRVRALVYDAVANLYSVPDLFEHGFGEG